jgi:hypothetical protein
VQKCHILSFIYHLKVMLFKVTTMCLLIFYADLRSNFLLYRSNSRSKVTYLPTFLIILNFGALLSIFVGSPTLYKLISPNKCSMFLNNRTRPAKRSKYMMLSAFRHGLCDKFIEGFTIPNNAALLLTSKTSSTISGCVNAVFWVIF